MKIYLLRYEMLGFKDGIQLFTTYKAAKRGAEKAINRDAYTATIYISIGLYKNEIQYDLLERIYKKKEE